MPPYLEKIVNGTPSSAREARAWLDFVIGEIKWMDVRKELLVRLLSTLEHFIGEYESPTLPVPRSLEPARKPRKRSSIKPFTPRANGRLSVHGLQEGRELKSESELSPVARQALAIIRKLKPSRDNPLTSPQIVESLGLADLAPKTFRKHVIPQLKFFGLKRVGNSGYAYEPG